jgi:hypothetical protein
LRAAISDAARYSFDCAISSSTSRSRSFPKKISSPTKNVGEPNVPRSTESGSRRPLHRGTALADEISPTR